MKYVSFFIILLLSLPCYAESPVEIFSAPVQASDFDEDFLRLDFTNTPPTGTYDMQFDKVNENILDLYIAGSLIHRWENVVAVVPPPPAAPDVNFEYENFVSIEFENNIEFLLNN